MWKRDEQPKPASPAPPSPAAAAPTPQPDSPPKTVAAQAVPNDGRSIRVKGEISASEDLVLHGRIEGKVSLPGHVLTIGPQAQITAEILARTLIVQGSMNGNVTATERFEIRPNGRMTGDVTCPSVVMNEGSEFSGRVDMRRSFAQAEAVPKDGDRRRDGSTT